MRNMKNCGACCFDGDCPRWIIVIDSSRLLIKGLAE